MKLKVDENAKALIFDIDGTLVDTMEVHYKAWQKMFVCPLCAGNLPPPFDVFFGGGKWHCKKPKKNVCNPLAWRPNVRSPPISLQNQGKIG